MQSQRFGAVQQQKLKLTPRLIESIRLLTLSTADLRDRIQEELEINPALELSSEVSGEVSLSDKDVSPGEVIPLDRTGDTQLSEASDVVMDDDFGDVNASGSSRLGDPDAHQAFLEGAISNTETLQEHLLTQLAETNLREDVFSLASFIIWNLNEQGFHREDPSLLPGGSNPRLLAEALDTVRRFDPAGTACADFRESLVFQAENSPDAPPLAIDILKNHFEVLERPRPETIARKLSVSPESAMTALEFIRTLDPFPGSRFGGMDASVIVPDVIVKRGEEGFVAVVNDEELPALTVSPFIEELSRETESSPETRAFARKSVADARWFIGSLGQRNATLLRAASAIVGFQKQFFLLGPQYLRPLRLRDVAAEIGMHEATISRISNGKYLQCEWGLFELKYFFSNSVAAPRLSGSAVPRDENAAAPGSKEAAKQVLKQIIEEEKGKVLSDQKLAELLSLRGIHIARRTVAKYRTELTIGSSFER